MDLQDAVALSVLPGISRPRAAAAYKRAAPRTIPAHVALET